MEKYVEAQVIDARHLKLKEPIEFSPGSTVMVGIKPAQWVSEEQEWYQLSSQGLEEAYSDEEPVYSLDNIKEHNPEYQP